LAWSFARTPSGGAISSCFSAARQPLGRSPPGVIVILQQKKVIVTISSAEQRKKAQTTFNELFRLR
jgi:hypothetical protein